MFTTYGDILHKIKRINGQTNKQINSIIITLSHNIINIISINTTIHNAGNIN